MAMRDVVACGRESDTGQGKELVQVVATEPELHVDGREFEQARDVTFSPHMGVPHGGVDRQAKGRAVVAQGQHRVTRPFGDQRQALVLALGTE